MVQAGILSPGGGYNGALVAGASLLGCNMRYKSVVAEGMRLPSVKEVLSMIVTFVFVVIGWIIFRSGTIEQTVGFISRLFILDTASIRIIGRLPLFYCVLLLLIEWIQRSKEHPLQFSSNLLNTILSFPFD